MLVKKLVAGVLFSSLLFPAVAVAGPLGVDDIPGGFNAPNVVEKDLGVMSSDIVSLVEGVLGEHENVSALAIKSIKGSHVGQYAHIGNWDGDILSPLTGAMGLTIVANNSVSDPKKITSTLFDDDGKRISGAKTLPDIVEGAIAGENKYIDALKALANKDGVLEASRSVGFDISFMDVQNCVSVLSEIYDLSNSSEDGLVTTGIATGVINGFKSGKQIDTGNDINTALKSVELKDDSVIKGAIFNDVEAHEYFKHEDEKLAKESGDKELKADRSHTLVNGFIYSQDEGFAISLVVPTEHAEEVLNGLISNISTGGVNVPKRELLVDGELSPEV